MRVAANLHFLFQEAGVIAKRYEAAAAAGFKLIETPHPYGENALKLREMLEKFGLEQVHINSPGLHEASIGFACLPEKKAEFDASMKTAIEYAKILQCPRIHVIAGIPSGNHSAEECEDMYVNNLKYACKLTAEENLTVYIEPISGKGHTHGYFLNSFDQALRYVEGLQQPNLKIQLDFFHAQGICGNLTGLVEKIKDHLGHVQVAQFPGRHEPDSKGELNFDYVFKLLNSAGYEGLISAEYEPKNLTNQGLAWIQKYGLSF